MHHPTYRIAHITAFVTPVVEHWLERESSMGSPHEGSIRRPITPWANTLTTELHLHPQPPQWLDKSGHYRQETLIYKYNFVFINIYHNGRKGRKMTPKWSLIFGILKLLFSYALMCLKHCIQACQISSKICIKLRQYDLQTKQVRNIIIIIVFSTGILRWSAVDQNETNCIFIVEIKVF